MSKKHIIILSGPTAVGKSTLSIKMAKMLNTSVISADSMQIYRKMDIGTAKIREDEKQGIKHYMIDIIEPSDNFSIKEYREMVNKIIDREFTDKKIPIICGGTGFYINSIIYDLQLNDDSTFEPLRDYLYKLNEEKGINYIRDLLRIYDKKSYDRIHVNDIKRNIRALEYFILQNKPFSENLYTIRKLNPKYSFGYYVLYKNRDALYKDINDRVDLMIEEGLVDEVKKLKEDGLDDKSQAMQAIGYKEINKYLNGEWTLEMAIEKIKQFSRNYAKRQMTWFRNDSNIKMINIENFKSQEEIINYIISEENKNGFFY